MEAINVLLAGPIPTVIAVLIALCLGAGYWFFVFPLVDEAKRLRTQNESLAADLVQNSSQLVLQMSAQLAEIKTICQSHSTTIAQDILPQLLEQHEAQQELLEELKAFISDLHNRDKRSTEDLQHTVERLIRAVSEINDKQSQISGVILGLSMTNAHNPVRGI